MAANQLIDIIIPAYNAHNTIRKTITSIASQTIVDCIKITIVNDGSKEDYSNIIEHFKDLVDIREITLKENCGCGTARNVGLDNTNLPYIMFVDADDILYSSMTCAFLLREFQQNYKLNAAYGGIREIELGTHRTIDIPSNHWLWIFGCMYNRKFIDNKKIRFYPNSAGEDAGFNKIVKLLSNSEIISFIPEITYLWTDANKKNRINTEEFIFYSSKPGLIENMIYVHNKLKEYGISYEELVQDAMVTMVTIYLHFLDLLHYTDEKEKIDVYIKFSKKLYKEMYAPYLSDITFENLTYIYNENLRHFIKDNHKWININDLTLYEFINILSK